VETRIGDVANPVGTPSSDIVLTTSATLMKDVARRIADCGAHALLDSGGSERTTGRSLISCSLELWKTHGRCTSVEETGRL
jgi:hypothetical protein